MKTIIFDFDHTLFDTKTFKQDVDSLIELEGIPPEIAKNAEAEFRGRNFNNYDFRGHIEEIKKQGHNISDDIHNKLNSLDLKIHIKGDVIGMVKKLRDKGYKTILLTKGVDEFQNLKINNSGIKEIFEDNIIICPNSKEDVLLKMDLNHAETYIFNDDVHEMARIKKSLPDATYIICKRKDDKFDYTNLNKSYHLIENINDIEKFIK